MFNSITGVRSRDFKWRSLAAEQLLIEPLMVPIPMPTAARNTSCWDGPHAPGCCSKEIGAG